ncbi:hypothetical protein [Ureaplasma ceti]|uniref:Uncharacterized protein n=1 Tax=Ureaplasma ceti TaxID=3119530 RepID=A0ABP9U5W6_9BACT
MELNITKTNFKQKVSTAVNHSFFGNDMAFAWTYLGLAIAFWFLSIPSYLLPQHDHSKYIILGGLIPLLILNIIIQTILLINVFNEFGKEFYKTWRFYILVWMLLCYWIGLPIAFHYIIKDYTAYAHLFDGLNGADKAGTNIPGVDTVHDPKVTEITIGIWFDIIFTFMNLIASVVMVVFIWKERHQMNNLAIVDEKEVEKYVLEHKDQLEADTTNRLDTSSKDKIKKTE